ncbi:MAG TPA: 4-hydroxy-3-methylbut-2-enyl diphosphate reductase [Gemmataceae bacterium]|nr:4-hydroxy-3-methylbut-2-enyl diphosphate reductase [Gemmataceae bacterium]
MKVLVAEVMGMCFGVRDALKIIEKVDDPEAVTIHGELVHNEAVLHQLEERGFRMTAEADRREVPRTPLVLITAHGVSNAERQRLESAGKRLIDTTCPLVERAHEAALKLQAEGRHVLVIGKRGHVEVEGVVGDLHSYDVIQGPEEVRTWPHARLGIMCQTTATARLVQEVRQAVAEKNPHADVRFLDTVCLPTKEHQRSLERLLGQVEAMVVVGGRNSNNTRELAARCREHGIPALHVQGAADLDPEWFAGYETVGLTAGTSTPDAVIAEVWRALLALKPTAVEAPA